MQVGARGAFACCGILVARHGQRTLLELAPTLPQMLLQALEQDVSVAKEAAVLLGEMVKSAANAASASAAGSKSKDAAAGFKSKDAAAVSKSKDATASTVLKASTVTSTGRTSATPYSDASAWCGVWLPVLTSALQGPSTVLRKRLAQLVLPKLFDVVSNAPSAGGGKGEAKAVECANVGNHAYAPKVPCLLPGNNGAADGVEV